jgi:hypothetical protein
MNKKEVGLVAMVITALLCGCPGLFGLCLGGLFVMLSQIPDASIGTFGSNDPQSALMFGFATLCLSAIFVAIPVLVGVFTLRKKPQKVTLSSPNEPIPPAI